MRAGLNQQVLVLNRLWQAVNICTVRRALTLLFEGRAQVVFESPDGAFNTFDFAQWKSFSQAGHGEEFVRSVSFKIRVPRVIVLLIFDRFPKKEVKFTRHNIFERDRNTCQYCGRAFERKDLNLDHVIPRDRGGPVKGNRTPREAGMGLIKKPKRPKWRPFIQINITFQKHDSWKHFIDMAYWNVELGQDPE
jgi:5-methylcytosine-specific restriction endonuclease McrA